MIHVYVPLDKRDDFSFPSTEEYKIIPVEVENWNDDLSPWKADGVFGEPFGGKAKDFLKKLLSIKHEVEKEETPSASALAGYSLAGLFCLWAITQTDEFSLVSCNSSSFWFEGFTEWLKNTPFACKPSFVLLSLGNKEKNARNPRLRTVEEKTLEVQAILKERGVPCEFVLHEGNHFKDADKRLFNGINAIAMKNI